MKSPPHPKPEQLHQLVYGLVYPAFLGSILYNTVYAFSVGENLRQDWLSVLCGFLVILLFAIDYVYSYSSNNTADYTALQSTIDFLVIALSYLAALSLAGTDIFPNVASWFYLFLAAFTSYLWEEIRYHRRKRTRFLYNPPLAKIKRKHANSDFACACLYLVLGLVSSQLDGKQALLPILLALIFQIVVYVYNVGDA